MVFFATVIEIQMTAILSKGNQRLGVIEPIKRILNSHNVKVDQKPFQTLGHFFAKPKDPERLYFNDAVMLLKCVNNLVPEYLASMFVARSRIHSRVTRSCNLLHIPRCPCCRCKLWNNLPNDLKASENVNAFRLRLLNALLSGNVTHDSN
ncbi:hypothetical protein pdam_00019189, partial [Pocillopora damicornis]